MNNDIINQINNFKLNNINFKYNHFDLILSGGGLKGFYHVGMCKILQEYEKNNEIKIRYIIGTSTGALTAVIYACNLDYNSWIESYYTIKKYINQSDLHRIVINILRDKLPENAYQLCNGKVKISLSRITIFGFYEEMIDTFHSNEHLLKVLSGAIKVPYVTSNTFWPEKINNNYYYDAYFVRMTPIIYNNDLPQLLIKTHLINYSNRLSLNPNDSFIELLSLRGLYESKKFLMNNNKNRSIKWIEKNYVEKKKVNYIIFIIPAIFYVYSIFNFTLYINN